MSSVRPLIGISVDRVVREPPVYSLPEAYVHGVRRAGGRAVILPGGDDDVPGLLDRLDGVVLSGGRDVDPRRYRGESHATIDLAGDERDDLDLALTGHTLERDLPLLSICRGLQVLNVALGGDLHPHLPDAVGDAVEHRAADRSPVRHDVRIVPGSLLADVLGATSLSVMSQHHQGVRRAGRGLRVVARAADDVVEGLEVADRRFCIAVQWHPEMTLDEPIHRRLFEALVDACR